MHNTFENLLKINRPINRMEFFKYTVCMIFLQVVLSLLFMFIVEKVFGLQADFWFSFIFLIFVILPLLYLYFIQFSKRLWDITGDNKIGLFAGIIIFIISAVCLSVLPVLTIVIYLILILLPGKIAVNE